MGKNLDFPDLSFAAYRYDALSRRIERDVNGVITGYVYDGLNILLEYDASDTLLARYSHGQRTDQPLAVARDLDASGAFEAGEQFFYQADHLGSVRNITDAVGIAVNAYDYDSYGRVEAIVEGIANPFTFTGREVDAESGLYFYRARYYDPATGRFLKQDPLGFAAGDPNLYRYVLNNPVKFTDPSGLVINQTCFSIIITAGTALCISLVAVSCTFCGPPTNWVSISCWGLCSLTVGGACLTNVFLGAERFCDCDTSKCQGIACEGIKECDTCPPES